MPRPPPPDDLLEHLEAVCLDAMRGDPPGPVLAARLNAVVRAWLHRAGVDARVAVESRPGRTAVTLWLGPTGPRVRQVVLTLG